jgi:hypothetical protein
VLLKITWNKLTLSTTNSLLAPILALAPIQEDKKKPNSCFPIGFERS